MAPKLVPPPLRPARTPAMSALEQAMQQLPLCPRFVKGSCKFGAGCKLWHGPGKTTRGSLAYNKMLSTGDLHGALESLPFVSVTGSGDASQLRLRAPLSEALNAYLAEHGGRVA